MPKSTPGTRSAEEWGRSTPVTRLPADETRKRLLDTALDMLRETGLTVTLEHLNMEVLIREAEVPRSSVYRLWGGKKAFFVDLMLELIKPESGQSQEFDPETSRVARNIVAANEHRMHDPDGRRAVLHEVIRLGVARNFQAVRTANSLRTHSALIATLPTFPDEIGEQVLAAISDADSPLAAGMASLYESLLSIFCWRMKDGLTHVDMAVAGIAFLGIIEAMCEPADNLSEQ